jgi:hypothetical protein
MTSPTAMTTPGEWTAFVCHVTFTTSVPDAEVQIEGKCNVLQVTTIPQTSSLLIANLDVPAVSPSGFGPGVGVGRGASPYTGTMVVPTPGKHFVGFIFGDADQNTDDGGIATQVWSKISYKDPLKAGSKFAHSFRGMDTSGNDPTVQNQISAQFIFFGKSSFNILAP